MRRQRLRYRQGDPPAASTRNCPEPIALRWTTCGLTVNQAIPEHDEMMLLRLCNAMIAQTGPMTTKLCEMRAATIRIVTRSILMVGANWVRAAILNGPLMGAARRRRYPEFRTTNRTQTPDDSPRVCMLSIQKCTEENGCRCSA
jgi:hypothetical protein